MSSSPNTNYTIPFKQQQQQPITINTFIRCKPIEQKTDASNQFTIINSTKLKANDSGKEYPVNHLFDSETDNEQLWDIYCKPVLDNCSQTLKNALFLVYGQTNTGKTHTILGKKPYNDGCLIRTMEYILKQPMYQISFAGMEIYSEDIKMQKIYCTDILQNEKMRAGQIYIHATFETINNKNDITNVIELIHENAHFDPRKKKIKNDIESSRGHNIFIIKIKNTTSRLAFFCYFIDLAGSEGINKKQSGYIRKSLSNVSQIIQHYNKPQELNIDGDPLKRNLKHIFSDIDLKRINILFTIHMTQKHNIGTKNTIKLLYDTNEAVEAQKNETNNKNKNKNKFFKIIKAPSNTDKNKLYKQTIRYQSTIKSLKNQIYHYQLQINLQNQSASNSNSNSNNNNNYVEYVQQVPQTPQLYVEYDDESEACISSRNIKKKLHFTSCNTNNRNNCKPSKLQNQFASNSNNNTNNYIPQIPETQTNLCCDFNINEESIPSKHNNIKKKIHSTPFINNNQTNKTDDDFIDYCHQFQNWDITEQKGAIDWISPGSRTAFIKKHFLSEDAAQLNFIKQFLTNTNQTNSLSVSKLRKNENGIDREKGSYLFRLIFSNAPNKYAKIIYHHMKKCKIKQVTTYWMTNSNSIDRIKYEWGNKTNQRSGSSWSKCHCLQ